MRSRFTAVLIGLVIALAPVMAPAQQRNEDLRALSELAREVLDIVNRRSIEENREFCAVILRSPTGDYSPSRVVAGTEATCRPPDPPPGFRRVATMHTHGPFSLRYDAEVPSMQDLRSDFSNNTFGFIATPSGRLWLVDPRIRAARILCGPGCVFADPAYDPRPAGVVLDTYTLDKLRIR
ncbi:MAG: DUF4329 domain-containing protein [Rubricella sp.]